MDAWTNAEVAKLAKLFLWTDYNVLVRLKLWNLVGKASKYRKCIEK